MLLFTSTPLQFIGKYCTFYSGNHTSYLYKIIKYNALLKINLEAPKLTKKQCLVATLISDVCEVLAVSPKRHFPSKLLRWFHLNNCSRYKEVKLSSVSQKKNR